MKKPSLPVTGLVCLLVLLLMGAVVAPSGALAQTPEAAPSLADVAPGQLLRAEPIEGFGEHPTWRILYASTDLEGNRTAVSGLIARPAGPEPEGGFPLLAVGHPTSGIARQCAPSLILLEGDSEMARLYRESLTPLLDAGYAIVMTDYQGLGAAGDPSYVIGQIEGQNILDSIRAAGMLPDLALSGDTVVTGHSQGGHAAIFAIDLVGEYAPEVAIDGVALLAPATDLGGIFADIMEAGEATQSSALVLFVLGAWSETYPETDLDDVATERGQRLLDVVIWQSCLIGSSLAAGLIPPDDLFREDALSAWPDLLEENVPEPGAWPVPVFVAHGEADMVIDHRFTTAFVEGLCAAGVAVDYRTYPGVDHFPVIAAAQDDLLAWLAGRLMDEPARSTC
jgi:alpha-beta hydrolase superfamily lysophospholipase